ncbi:O-antigen ligase family protein [Thermodesulfobacteriota bacterium]
MNNLSASEPTRSQNTWSSLPWGTFLFLLAVFVYATPLLHFKAFFIHGIGVGDADAVANVMARDNWMRIVALSSLGVFALFNILRSKVRQFQINGLLGWLILLYIVLAVLSITWSTDPKFTLKRVGILLFLCLGALYFAERYSLQEIIALFIFICAVAVLFGLFESLRFYSFRPFVGSWRFGGNLHPIAQGWHLGLLLLSVFVLSKTTEQNRAVYLGITFVAFLLLILTRSRVALVSCIMGSVVYWFMVSTKRYQGPLLFLVIISGVCSIYFLLGSEFTGFGEKVVMLGRGQDISTTKTFTGRLPLWENLMQVVNERPFLGFGYDSFISSKNLPLITEKIGWATPNTHSGYMSTLGGLGYIGCITLILILFLSVKMSIGLAKRNSEYAFIVAVLVWLILNLLTEDQILTRPYFPTFAWMILLARLGFIREKR